MQNRFPSASPTRTLHQLTPPHLKPITATPIPASSPCTSGELQAAIGAATDCLTGDALAAWIAAHRHMTSPEIVRQIRA